jgi:hypothetical protein
VIQLGTRWSVGDDAPSSLPQAVLDAVLEVEADLGEAGVDTADWKWTLTWLEGRPVVELDDDTVIEYDPATDEATVTPGE